MIPSNTTDHASGRRKTICTSSVLAYFGIHHSEFHYAEDSKTVKSILRRKGFSVKSRASLLGVNKGITVGALRKVISKKISDPSIKFYMGVIGHAMVIDGTGKTVVDTAPRKKDRRRVTHISMIQG